MKRSEARRAKTANRLSVDDDKPRSMAERAAKGGGKKKGGEGEIRIPHDPVNESVVIAAASVDRKWRKKLIAMFPTPDPFYGKGHAEAWEGLIKLEHEGLEYDPATIRQLMGSRVDVEYLDQLVRDRPEAPLNLVHHIERLQWDRTRVEAVRGPVASLLEAVRDPTSEMEHVQRLAHQVGSAFGATTKYLRDPAQLIREQMVEIQRRRDGVACYPFGIEGLDKYDDDDPDDDKAGTWRLIPGCAPSMITMVTGLSGSGKTTATANIAIAQANMKRRVLYAAWEQGSGLTLELCALISLGISRTRAMTGNITDTEARSIEQEMERLSEFIRFFELPFERAKGKERGDQINDRHLDLIHSQIELTACDVLIADLWRRALRSIRPEDEEHALYRQQAICQKTKAHLIAVHQLRGKDVETREDKRPTREALKGSGGYLDVASTVIGFHRPALWKNVPDDVIEALILKQRFAPWPLAVELDYDGEHGHIGGGRSIEYLRPGETGEVDSFLDEAEKVEKKGRGRGRRGRRS